MTLKLTNTLTGNKEEFKPLKENEVSIYVCGVTLYDDIHIGHLKSIVAFEVMRNYFSEKGYYVKLVRNITDIDDKIIAKAEQNQVNPLTLVNQYIDKYHDLLNQLDITPPDLEPRVTQYLKEIEDYINDLKNKGYAYETEDGIYFNTQINTPVRYPLSKKIVKDLENKTRLTDEDHTKHHKADFALWKKDNKYGYQSSIFKSAGRPGWHIECSVMHHHTLGKQFDIHGGGRDLIFPHHENEILQSVAHNDVNPSNYWIHNGMMTKEGKKLSKSLGNSIYVKDLLNTYTPEALKLFLNKGQYNQSQEFNEDELKEANDRWNNFVENIPTYKENIDYNSIYENVIKALEDDFNTPVVLTLLYAGMKELNQTKSKELANELLKITQLISVVAPGKTLNEVYDNWNQKNILSPEIQLLVDERTRAKNEGDYKRSDEIRNILKAKGWEIKDNREGFSLKKI